jgi:hypothetical protein
VLSALFMTGKWKRGFLANVVPMRQAKFWPLQAIAAGYKASSRLDGTLDAGRAGNCHLAKGELREFWQFFIAD